VPVYAFAGNDELRKHEALEAALEKWDRSEADTTPVRETHFGEELNTASVAESYQTPDLFAPRKTIVLKNFDKLSAADQKLLEEAFLSDNPQASVFLTAGKIDGRSAFAKALDKAGRLFEFKLPYDNKIPAWLVDRARQRYDRKLGLAEARVLQDIVGNETSDLDHELGKLDTFLPKHQAITAEAITDVVSPLKVHIFFEFQKAAGMCNPRDFLPAMRNLLDHGTDGFVVAPRLFHHFLTLTRIRAMLDEGAGEQQIEETCKLNHYIHIVKEHYLDQARTRTLYRWKQLLVRLARLEWEMKQGRYPHRFEVEMALVGIGLTK
jgi:DNA polymerase-3 subunit delta